MVVVARGRGECVSNPAAARIRECGKGGLDATRFVGRDRLLSDPGLFGEFPLGQFGSIPRRFE